METDYREEIRQGRLDITDPTPVYEYGTWPCGCKDEQCEDCKQGLCEHN